MARVGPIDLPSDPPPLGPPVDLPPGPPPHPSEVDAIRLEALRLAVEVWRGQGANAQTVLYCAREFEEHLREASPGATVKTDESGQG